MHKSKMIAALKELKIDFITVYPHTEKVKFLDGTIRRLKDISKESKPKYKEAILSRATDIPGVIEIIMEEEIPKKKRVNKRR